MFSGQKGKEKYKWNNELSLQVLKEGKLIVLIVTKDVRESDALIAIIGITRIFKEKGLGQLLFIKF